MLDTWKLPPGPDRARGGHLRAEIIRSIFDVDEMMYFVAPEWWLPRRHQSALQVSPDAGRRLAETDVVAWRDQQTKRPDDYLITESSLAQGFDPGAPAGAQFAQWLTILPTDQIVAAEYQPSTIETP